MDFATASRPRWRTILKRARALEVQRHGAIEVTGASGGVLVPDQVHMCGECAGSFATRGSLNTHFARAHLSSIARPYAAGDVGRGCFKRFTSRSHVVHHLAISKRRCLELVRLRCAPLTAEQTAELDQMDCCARRRAIRAVGGAPHGANWPAHRVQGPLLRPLLPPLRRLS